MEREGERGRAVGVRTCSIAVEAPDRGAFANSVRTPSIGTSIGGWTFASHAIHHSTRPLPNPRRLLSTLPPPALHSPPSFPHLLLAVPLRQQRPQLVQGVHVSGLGGQYGTVQLLGTCQVGARGVQRAGLCVLCLWGVGLHS